VKYKVFSSFILLGVLLACSNQKIDTSQVQKEMEAREIKVVSDAQILEKAMEIGNALAKGFLLEETETGLEAKVDSTKANVSFYFFDRGEQPTGKELAVFKAYDYNRKNSVASTSNVQKLDNGQTLLYTTPMVHQQQIVGMWSVKLSRKEVVLSIED
jgi:hypothetical protein